ncbi:MAG TPA: prepilin-type N-terminal cleavage/methylation domain-containing protein, partial [Candidatus Saccharimonadales bacterium]|nr:prepilin-type N-terminal cleavage/methylation domain-containing protein [Candidatus Saccharimonadales bacterium]
MLKDSPQSGFTLIETVIVLAISGALVTIALSGQSQLRENSQFSDAIEKVKNNLVLVKNEANTTVNDRVDPNRGQDPAGRSLFGKMVEFTSGSDIMTVTTLTINQDLDQLQRQDSYSIRIPWGVTFNPAGGTARQYVTFTRDPNTGRMQTYTPPDWPDAQLLRPDNYTAAIQAPVNLPFRDPSGRAATVTVDPAT